MLFDGTCTDWDSVTLAELPGVTLILAWLENTKDIVLKGLENVQPFHVIAIRCFLKFTFVIGKSLYLKFIKAFVIC